jgi:hypothetical protein
MQACLVSYYKSRWTAFIDCLETDLVMVCIFIANAMIAFSKFKCALLECEI